MRFRSNMGIVLGGMLFCICLTPARAYVAERPERFLQLPATASFLLVANYKLKDPRFRKSVVLVSRGGHGGPTGVIVNRPLDITLDKVFPAYPAARNAKLHFGGPVYPRQISYLFRSKEVVAGTQKVAGNIHVSSDMSLLGELLGGTRAHSGLLVVTGLAAWAPGQLENEVAHGDWHILQSYDGLIFDYPAETMWQESLRRATIVPQ